MAISKEKLTELAIAHASRVVLNMDEKDLQSYAIQMMVDSYCVLGKCSDGGDRVDQDALVEDLFDYCEGDRASVVEFLSENGVSDQDIAEIVFEDEEDFG
jgi:hypothetical protein